ncbi:hypothetical protein Gohar_017586, partial [Gossypium harknessii]|nr:hypothetical protein [Gossypium harknessii]
MAAANHSNKSSIVDKGCFSIYTMDKKRFVIPLAFLSNSVFRELFKMSEEEFGLPSDGPITLPCDSVVMNYIVSIVKRGLAKDLEKAVLNFITTYSCSLDNKKPFLIPLAFLINSIFQALLKMSEEEFGLSSNRPLTFLCDSVIMSYIVLLVRRGLAKDLEKAVVNSISSNSCS